MKRQLIFIVQYLLAFIIFFAFCRLLFLLFNLQQAKEAGVWPNLLSQWYGLRMDMSMAAYIVLPVCLFLLMGFFIPFFRRAHAYKIYSAVILLLLLLIIASDVNAFKAWGYRLDASVLKYLESPKEAWASASYLPIGWILVGTLFCYGIFYYLLAKIIGRYASESKHMPQSWLQPVVILLVTAMLIIPIRGGWQLAPLNQSAVYFSSNNFSNQAALNAPWNFLYTLNHGTNDKTNPYIFFSKELSKKIVDSLYANQDKIKLPGSVNEKPNVIVIIWESFTEKAIHLARSGVDITPGFNKLRSEGIYFSNMFASGDRTDKGIVAVLSGYPAQPTNSIVKIPNKAASLPVLSKTFNNLGYSSSFYYGGELEFANMKAYLLNGAFAKYVSVEDFKKTDLNSKWGAHDGVVAEKILAELPGQSTPFFLTWLTLSSHEPFETPVSPVITGNDHETMFLNSLHYSDSILYRFVGQCRKMPWWNNTLLLIVADHGHRLPETGKKTDDFRIPFLLLGGKITAREITHTTSQTDLPSILLNMLHLQSTAYSWSKNSLDSSTVPWAYFSFNNGFGFVNNSGSCVFDNVGKRPIQCIGDTALIPAAGKAMEQLTFQDFLDR